MLVVQLVVVVQKKKNNKTPFVSRSLPRRASAFQILIFAYYYCHWLCRCNARAARKFVGRVGRFCEFIWFFGFSRKMLRRYKPIDFSARETVNFCPVRTIIIRLNGRGRNVIIIRKWNFSSRAVFNIKIHEKPYLTTHDEILRVLIVIVQKSKFVLNSCHFYSFRGATLYRESFKTVS